MPVPPIPRGTPNAVVSSLRRAAHLTFPRPLIRGGPNDLSPGANQQAGALSFAYATVPVSVAARFEKE